MVEIDVKLRELVRLRAGGQCEYFRISEAFTLAEHKIASIDRESGRLTPLFHPRIDYWGDHFELKDGTVFALTAKGRVTIKLLRMNLPARIS